MLQGGSYDRGASVVGVLLLLAVVGAFAIQVDSLSSRPNESQLAVAGGTTGATAVTAPPASTQSTDATAGAGSIGETCRIGHDYVVYVNKNGERRIGGVRLVTEGILTNTDPEIAKRSGAIFSITIRGTDYSRCEGLSENEKKVVFGVGVARTCNATWRCRVYECFETNLLDNGVLRGDTCRYLDDAPVGGSFESKESQSTGGGTTPKPGAEETKTEAPKVETLPTEEQKALAEINKDQQTSYDQIDKAYELERLNNKAACSSLFKWTGLSNPECPSPEELAAAQKAREDAIKKLDQLAIDEKRLTGSKVTLYPSTGSTEGTENVEAPGNASQRPPGPKFDSTFSGPDVDRCRGVPIPPDCVEKRSQGTPDNTNTNRNNPSDPIVEACQRGDRQACLRLAGNGGGGSGGGGSMLGNILGSLFGKNQQGKCQPLGTLVGTCEEPPKPTCQITATRGNSANTGQTGQTSQGQVQPVTLSWRSSANTHSGWLSSGGQVAPQGTMIVYPQVTTTYVLQIDGFRDRQTGQQQRGECETQVTIGGNDSSGQGGNGGGAGSSGKPKAELSCSPKIADVGMPVAISFGCANSSTSAGSGFSTDKKLSGSASPKIEAPLLGSNDKQTFGLTCMKEGTTDTKECTVKVNQTSILFIVDPNKVASGSAVNISWTTGGIEGCVIENDDLPGFTEENADDKTDVGTLKSPLLTSDTEFTLVCTTRAGGTRTVTQKVDVE